MTLTRATELDQDIIDKIEKLLRLAGKNPNQHEAASAMAKAQELMEAYNLDMAAIEQGASSSKASKRADEKLNGGLYKYQRELWGEVARLNFCLYWNLYEWDPDKKRPARKGRPAKIGGYRFRHRLVGRVVNITSARIMAEYLEQTIERLTRERLHGDGTQFFTEWAVQYREGIAFEVCEKLRRRRQQLLKEEEDRVAEARKREADKAAGAVSTGVELTLASAIKSEDDANIDFIYGEGTSARWAADKAERAERQRKAQEAYTKWAQENPEEAKAAEEEQRKARRRRPWNWGMNSKEDRKWYSGGFQSGRDAGKGVSIDPQMGDGTARKIK